MEDIERLAFGGDTTVYKKGDSVYKRYDGGPFRSRDFKPHTQEQIEFYQKITNRAAELNSLPSISGHRLVINPIDEVSKDGNYVVSVSPFIRGDTLAKSEAIPNLRQLLWRLSREFERRLGVEGIALSPFNIKKTEEDAWVVTDLCESVRALKPKDKGDS